ncbi:MAG: hypothetical protein K8T10_16165 [Candidatus Eremiobacteraeota bacterium]|nr:hypothetical protein [Candidatus Eremiobacteraeota bacterium]
MFNLLNRTCGRCSGALVNEWKIDLPKVIEIVCLNCGARLWEKIKNKARKKQACKKSKRNRQNMRIIDKPVRADIMKCFEEDRHRQILKHQSQNRNNKRRKKKLSFSYLGKNWQET